MGAFATKMSAEGTDSGYKVTIEYTTRLDTSAYPNWADAIDHYYGLTEAIGSFKVEGNTRYEKVKSIHDSICKKVSYDYEFSNPIAHEPTSVFYKPFKAVCEGYAEAFKLICDKEGIPCICVSGYAGGAHAWNYVKNGKRQLVCG